MCSKQNKTNFRKTEELKALRQQVKDLKAELQRERFPLKEKVVALEAENKHLRERIDEATGIFATADQMISRMDAHLAGVQEQLQFAVNCIAVLAIKNGGVLRVPDTHILEVMDPQHEMVLDQSKDPLNGDIIFRAERRQAKQPPPALVGIDGRPLTTGAKEGGTEREGSNPVEPVGHAGGPGTEEVRNPELGNQLPGANSDTCGQNISEGS